MGTKTCRRERRFLLPEASGKVSSKDGPTRSILVSVSISNLLGDRILAQEGNEFVRKRNQANFFVAASYSRTTLLPSTCLPPVASTEPEAGFP